MRVVLDACVLFPTVMRSVLIGAADAGLYTPFWSARILEEWRRAGARQDPDVSATSDIEIALLKSRYPKAAVPLASDLPDNLYLPDPDDVHVLETAIAGGADEIVTANIKDFPQRVLARHGIIRRDPDTFLLEFAHSHPQVMDAVVWQVVDAAIAHSGQPQPVRALLKKTRLPRLAKHYANQPRLTG